MQDLKLFVSPVCSSSSSSAEISCENYFFRPINSTKSDYPTLNLPWLSLIMLVNKRVCWHETTSTYFPSECQVFLDQPTPSHACRQATGFSVNKSTFNEVSSISNQLEAVLSYLPRDDDSPKMMHPQFLDSSSKSSLSVKARAAAGDSVRPRGWRGSWITNVASCGRRPTQNHMHPSRFLNSTHAELSRENSPSVWRGRRGFFDYITCVWWCGFRFLQLPSPSGINRREFSMKQQTERPRNFKLTWVTASLAKVFQKWVPQWLVGGGIGYWYDYG